MKTPRAGESPLRYNANIHFGRILYLRKRLSDIIYVFRVFRDRFGTSALVISVLIHIFDGARGVYDILWPAIKI
jgi:hypothetical protein